MSATNQKGDVGELAVAAELVRLGYNVSIPFGHDSKYDLVVEVDGELKKVQVKSTHAKNGLLKVKVGSTSNILKGKHQFQSYTAVDFDYFIIYDLTGGNCYLLPMTLIEKTYDTISLRIEPTRNNQNRNIHWAHAYLLESL